MKVLIQLTAAIKNKAKYNNSHSQAGLHVSPQQIRNTNMRVSVHLYDADGKEVGVHSFPWKDAANFSVSQLKQEILASVLPSEKNRIAKFQLELAGSGKILRDEEVAEKVLRDGDSVCLRKCMLLCLGQRPLP